MADGEKNTIVEGSTVKLIKQKGDWKVEIMHKGGGISGRLAGFETLEAAVEWIKDHYDVQ